MPVGQIKSLRFKADIHKLGACFYLDQATVVRDLVRLWVAIHF